MGFVAAESCRQSASTYAESRRWAPSRRRATPAKGLSQRNRSSKSPNRQQGSGKTFKPDKSISRRNLFVRCGVSVSWRRHNCPNPAREVFWKPPNCQTAVSLRQLRTLALGALAKRSACTAPTRSRPKHQPLRRVGLIVASHAKCRPAMAGHRCPGKKIGPTRQWARLLRRSALRALVSQPNDP